jgi:hypothetical protein
MIGMLAGLIGARFPLPPLFPPPTDKTDGQGNEEAAYGDGDGYGRTSGATKPRGSTPKAAPKPHTMKVTPGRNGIPVAYTNIMCNTGSKDYIDGCKAGGKQGRIDGTADGVKDQRLAAARILPYSSQEINTLVQTTSIQTASTQKNNDCAQIKAQTDGLGIDIASIFPDCNFQQSGGAMKDTIENKSTEYAAGYKYAYNLAYNEAYTIACAVIRMADIPEDTGYGYGYGDKEYGEKEYGEKEYGEKEYGSQRGGRIQSLKRHVKNAKPEKKYSALLKRTIEKTTPV